MADSFDSAFAELGLDPNTFAAGPVARSSDPNMTPTAGTGLPQAAQSAPQAGQFANNQQGFLDWATQQYGADPSRGQGFVNAQAGGGLQNMLRAYGTATGNTAEFQGGPSGDRVNFGAGTQDALTSGGQIWNPAGGSGGGAPSGGGLGGDSFLNGRPTSGGFGVGGNVTLPNAPSAQDLTAPSPFTYQPSTLGNFQGPAPYQAPAVFQGGGPVPNAPNLQAERVADPQRLSYQDYKGPTAEEFAADPGRQFREQQALGAQANILAHAGALRSGNALQAQGQLASDLASQEYNNAYQRGFQTNQANNQGNFQVGQANIGNQFNATQANNQNAFNVGNQNFQNSLASQGQGYGQAANTYGLNASTQQGAQAQNFNQGLAAYGANQSAQNQGFNQSLAAYGQNANTGLAYGQANQNNQLANYQSQVNAALGLGNLNLGFQDSAQNYDLGRGNLGVSQGQLGLAQQGQQFNQGLQTYQQNYQNQVLDPWNMNFQLAGLGNPGAPNTQGNANAQSDLLTGQGNALASGQVGSANQWTNALGNLSTIGQGAYQEWLRSQRPTT